MRNNIHEPECPVCGDSEHTSFAFRRNGNTIHTCHGCNLEFLFPQPTDDTLASIYSSSYFLGSKSPESIRRQEALKRATAKLYLDIIAPFIQAHNPKLLEVGCGSGDFLVEAESRGFEVEGLEYSEHAAAGTNLRLGHQAVRVGSPEGKYLPPDRYDVIGAFDVIEHLRDPKQSLVDLHRALKPGGLLAIVTPCLDSWSRQLLGRHWMEYKTEHLTYFSRRSLAQLFKKAGFAKVQFFPNYKVLSFDYVAAHFERFRVPILSHVIHALRSISPENLAHRPIRIVASGITAIARKGR